MGYSSATSEPSAAENPNRAFLLNFLGRQSDRSIQEKPLDFNCLLENMCSSREKELMVVVFRGGLP